MFNQTTALQVYLIEEFGFIADTSNTLVAVVPGVDIIYYVDRGEIKFFDENGTTTFTDLEEALTLLTSLIKFY